MSTSSLYGPEEDDEFRPAIDICSDQSQPAAAPASAVPSTKRRRAKKKSREEVLQKLYTSLPPQLIEAYSHLLAEEQAHDNAAAADDNNAPSDPALSGIENWNETQHGVVTWTPREKEILHTRLERTGPNGIADIAREVGTKSELEVQEYLRLLHQGLEYQHIRDRQGRTAVFGEVPAAAEISSSCCRALDKYADLLCFAEMRTAENEGRRKHQGLWILDRDTTKKVEDRLEAPAEDEGTGALQSSIFQTVQFFHVNSWLKLSERLFMNPGGDRLDDNWTNVAFADERPSMTVDALADFYALAVSLTRRLVQSALFFAMARLRNMRETGNEKAQVVRSRDVRTALDVLNMKRDRSDYWVGLARRCNLEVADLRHRLGWKPRYMTYDEVEGVLSGEIPLETEADTRSSSKQRPRIQADDETDVEDVSDYSSEDDPERPSEPAVLSSPVVSSDEGTPLDIEEEHAEQVDEQTSRREERRLWEILGEPAPTALDPEIKDEDEQESKSRRPFGERRTKEEFVNWRDRTLYRSDWEEYGYEVFDLYEEMSQSRRKRRRFVASGSEPVDEGRKALSEESQEAAEASSRNENGYETMDIDHAEAELPANTSAEREGQPQNSSDSSAASAHDSDESNHPPLQPKQLRRVRKANDITKEESSSSQDDLLPPNRANPLVRKQK
ncbi:hypothetical protein BDV59DRAFT_180036 [Aspergillus ambiguus]|uniref:uncharacterized protein n=1 Tax=Aspergillus ambiguus TaxID=176160 RepID=UPI003CCCC002